MDLREVPPGALEISDMNERTLPPETSKLVKSIEQQGVVQPPIVRVTDKGGEGGGSLEVVVGQRRTLAAREAGRDRLPVVVMDWNDAEALEASITENIDAFREDVTDNERAAAVTQMMDLRGETKSEIADRLGVSKQAVSDWLEGTRPEWEGTDFEPGFKRQKSESSNSTPDSDIYTAADGGAQEVSSSVGGSTMRKVRTATEGEDKETREEMAHRVEKGELNQSDVSEITRSVGRGASVDEATEQVTSAKDTSGGGTIGVQLTLPGDVSEQVTERAERNGVSEEEIIRRAVRTYLDIEQ